MFKSTEAILQALKSELFDSFHLTIEECTKQRVKFWYKGSLYGLDVQGGAYLCEGGGFFGSEEAMLLRKLAQYALTSK